MSASNVTFLASPELRIVRLHHMLGAEISGLDIAAPLPDATVQVLKLALAEHLVLVFRGQRITPAQQVAFSRGLGRLVVHPLDEFLLPGTPENLLESNEVLDGHPVGLGDAEGPWHADLSYTARPNLTSALYAAVVPPEGSVTRFANQYIAYERLDPWIAHRIEFLTAEHHFARRRSAALAEARRDVALPIAHPVVRIDPASGRRGLFVNEGTTTRIIGVTPAESEWLLHRLLAAATDPAVTYRHEWRPHDLLVWDNHAALHRAEFADPGRPWRLHRTMVGGDRPYGPASVTVPWVVAG